MVNGIGPIIKKESLLSTMRNVNCPINVLLPIDLLKVYLREKVEKREAEICKCEIELNEDNGNINLEDPL